MKRLGQGKVTQPQHGIPPVHEVNEVRTAFILRDEIGVTLGLDLTAQMISVSEGSSETTRRFTSPPSVDMIRLRRRSRRL